MHRLRDEYKTDLEVVELNAQDAGRDAFEKSGLPGHPGFIILMPDGTERYRAFGIVGEEKLRAAIIATLAG